MEFIFKDIPEGFFKAELSGAKEGKWSLSGHICVLLLPLSRKTN